MTDDMLASPAPMPRSVAQPTSNFARAKLNNFQSRRHSDYGHQQLRDQSIFRQARCFPRGRRVSSSHRPLRGSDIVLLKQLPKNSQTTSARFVGCIAAPASDGVSQHAATPFGVT